MGGPKATYPRARTAFAVVAALGVLLADAPASASETTADRRRLTLDLQAGGGFIDPRLPHTGADRRIDAGLGLAWRFTRAFSLSAEGDYALYRRRHVSPHPSAGGGHAAVRLDEHAAGAALAARLDVAALLDVTWMRAGFGPYLGARYRQQINDVWPATVLGPMGGAEAWLWPSRDLRVGVGADYTYEVGRHFLEQAPSLAGLAKGALRYRGALGVSLPPRALLSFGYQGEWVAYERDDVLAHTAVVSLTLGFITMPGAAAASELEPELDSKLDSKEENR